MARGYNNERLTKGDQRVSGLAERYRFVRVQPGILISSFTLLFFVINDTPSYLFYRIGTLIKKKKCTSVWLQC